MTYTKEKIAEKLNQAADLLEAGWCQEDYARNKQGKSVSTFSSEACYFCAIGSLFVVTKDEDDDLFSELRKVLCNKLGDSPHPGNLVYFNDAFGQDKNTVVKFFRDTIVDVLSGTIVL